MKAAVIAIVVLSLAANSPANGQDPGSEGVQCAYKCINPDSEGTSFARSSFQQVAHRDSASEGRQCTGGIIKDMICVEDCQVDKYTIIAREVRRISEHYCGDSVNQTTREKYLADNDQLTRVWFPETDKCEPEVDTAEAVCKAGSDCFFGSTLSSARNGFSDDVVRVNVLNQKINYATFVETRYGENLPNSCDFLFKPNVPEPPYQPEPYPYEPYPYDPYPYEAYQPEHYQRNPYGLNAYQRNPYQRNSYRRNPYQRKAYRRNPY